MEGLRVRCQSCGLTLYETTQTYDPNKPLDGSMLRLLPLYKDWPTYDGSLGVESTPRFLMFCSNCANYISKDGKLKFVDLPDKVGIAKVVESSNEPQKAEQPILTPKELDKEIDKRAYISRSKSKKKQSKGRK